MNRGNLITEINNFIKKFDIGFDMYMDSDDTIRIIYYHKKYISIKEVNRQVVNKFYHRFKYFRQISFNTFDYELLTDREILNKIRKEKLQRLL